MRIAKANKKKILVVEDEPAINRVCTRTLIPEGFDVDIAVNGKVAMDVLKRHEYTLFLIDIRTPEMNGIELCQHMKKYHPELLDKVIFTTGDVMSDGIKTLLEEVNRPCLPKPFTPVELRAIVRKALN